MHNYSKLRLWGNYFFCWIQQLILKQKVYDLGAYLAFNLKTLKTLPFAHINPNMAYHPNLILIGSQVSPRLFRFCEFPVSWGGVESSNINPYKYFLSQLWMLLCIFLKRYSLKKNYLKTMNTKIIYSNL